MSHPHGDPKLEAIAKDTMRIVTAGGYTSPGGQSVDIAAPIEVAIAGTRTFSPEDLDRLLDAAPGDAGRSGPPRIEVTHETTQQATRRLCSDEHIGDPVLLNFASATRAGGGFLRGAKAQEEDLARCSALFACLQTQTEFYAFHRMQGSDLYSDRMIYSPRVPFFRVTSENLLEAPYHASVITAAAPNASKLPRSSAPSIEPLFRRRTGKLLALAEHRGHRTLVLGAWGTGVFGNDPTMAADSFGQWIESPRFRTSFDRIVFAIYDRRPDQPSYTPFAKRFSS
jgi:uncharacterized protein (TIGR02452 family)